MPTLRALGAEMARWFDRTPDTGMMFVREFQAQKLFVKGRQGGRPEEQPMATSCDGVFMFMSFIHGGTWKDAIREAQVLFTLRPERSTYLETADGRLGASPAAPLRYKNLGHHLACVVRAYRTRELASNLLAFDKISVAALRETGSLRASLYTASVPFPNRPGADVYREDVYSAPLAELVATNPDIKPLTGMKYRTAIAWGFDGVLLRDIAWLLGHLGDASEDRVDFGDAPAGPLPIDQSLMSQLVGESGEK